MTKDFRFGDYNEDGNNQEIAGADVIYMNIYSFHTFDDNEDGNNQLSY